MSHARYPKKFPSKTSQIFKIPKNLYFQVKCMVLENDGNYPNPNVTTLTIIVGIGRGFVVNMHPYEYNLPVKLV